ncbi:MAG: CBS domain-containing protein [Methanosarcinaceae archaeon]|nr:CBS domain-containing protein [Methanosarcinaceae archaeon]
MSEKDKVKEAHLPKTGSECDEGSLKITDNCSGVSINDIMTTDIVIVVEEDSIEDVFELFKKYNFHIYPVVNSEGALTGLIDQDIILEMLLFDRIPRDKHTHLTAVRSLSENAKGIMTHHPVTIVPETTLYDAADLMMKHHINRVYVVDKEKLVGVVSKRDIINEVYRRRGLN